MQVQMIPVGDIVVEKTPADERTFSKDFAASLAKSIQSEGLLYEPIVKPIADQPGKHRLLAGKHRAYACKNILKWTEIPCKVGPADMTEDEAKAIEIAENVWRNNLSDAQLKKALITWNRIYEAKHPAASGKGSAAKQAKVVKKKVAEAEAKGEEVDEAKVAAEVAAENKPFSTVIKETLKVSAATAGRLARVAKHLESEHIDILENHKVTDHVTDKLAALGDRDLIVKAISLIASGMDHQEAVRQAGKPKREAKAAEKKGPTTKEQRSLVPRPGMVVPGKPKDTDLTDDEWLATHCDPTLKSLKRKGPFKRDAILYRRMAETLVKFRTSAKKPLAEAKHADGNGGFFGAMVRVVKASHPSKWQVCGGCNGAGHVLEAGPDGKEAKKTCAECRGAAYKLAMQD